MNKSKIAWTDYSGGCGNFVLRGKAKGDCEISPGCTNCYAGGIRRRSGCTPDQTTYSEQKLQKLSKWHPKDDDNKQGPGTRPMVFVVDMGDLFHHRVHDDFILRAFDVMADRSDIDFQVLTKRPERMASLIRSVPEHIWIGTTCENQQIADQRIPHLQSINASVRFLSVEPMLGPVTLDLVGIGWVICGGESGGKRRPFQKEWAIDLWRQCKAAGVPFFFKQGSHLYPGRDDLLDGESVKEWPISVGPLPE